MLPLLTLHLFDVLELWDATEPILRLPAGKGTELLALLAYRPLGVPRSEVAGLLWPDAPASASRHRLRTLLLEMGQRYDGLLEIARDRVGLGPRVTAPLDGAGTFAPGIEGEWIEEARADLAYRLASQLVLAAQEKATEDPLGAIGLAERAQRLVPESLAADALLTRLRSRPSRVGYEAAPYLSVRDRARIAVARTPRAMAAGEMRATMAEIDAVLAELPPDPPLRASLLVARAGLAHEVGEYAASRRAVAEATGGTSDVRPGPAETAWAQLWIARVGYSSGEFDAAMTHARAAVRLARGAEERSVEVLGECLLGASEILRGHPDRVGDHLGRARTAAGREAYLVARCDNVAGWAELATGASVRALRAFGAALEPVDGDLRLMANVRQGLARAHEMAGNRVAARGRLEEAVALLEGTELDLILVGVLAALADLDEAEGRYAEALELHRRGLARRAGAGDRLGSFTSLAGIGRLTLRLGHASEAVRPLREAYALHTTLLGEVRLPIAALPLAEALLASGRRREAAGLVARSVEILKDEAPEVRAGNAYPAEIPVLAETLRMRLLD